MIFYFDDILAKVLRITIKSVGCFDPPYHGSNCDETVGSIVVNGIEMSQNKQGFNFVLIDFKTGEMEQAVSFDTHGEAGAYQKLEEFLGSLEMWKIVCVAVKDDGKNYLPDSALKYFVSQLKVILSRNLEKKNINSIFSFDNQQ